MKHFIYVISRLLLVVIFLFIISVKVFSQPGWTYQYTGSNGTILIQTGTVTINGTAISTGDYIGAFYDSLGTLGCGGYVIWQGSTNAIAVWGTQSTVNPDGFATGELIKFKVWQASTGLVFMGNAILQNGLSPTYSTNGLDFLASLNCSEGAIIVHTNVTCHGHNNGFAEAYLSGISSGISGFLWSNGATTQAIDSLYVGIYSVTINLTSGGSYSDTCIVTEPSEIVTEFLPANPDSAGATDGNIQLTVTGGYSPYSFYWSNGANTQNLTFLCSGTYYVTVSDISGCQHSASCALAFGSWFFSGHVSSSGINCESCAVLLIRQVVQDYTAIDYSITQNGLYQFFTVAPGYYRIFAIPDPDLPAKYLSSYYGNSFHWANSTQVQADQNHTGLDINIPVLVVNTGNGTISGLVRYHTSEVYESDIYNNNWFGSSGIADKQDNFPARNMPVILFRTDNTPVAFDLTGIDGSFHFQQIPDGSYFIYTEKAGFLTMPVFVTINQGSAVISNITVNIDPGYISRIEEQGMDESLALFPNPARDMVHIHTSAKPFSNLLISLYSCQGLNILAENRPTDGNADINLRITNLSPGIYFYSIVLTDGTKVSGRFIKD